VEVITPSGRPISLAIDEESMAGEARRAATALAGHLGFDETGRGKVAIVATEAATNLCKHAKAGEIVLQGFEAGEIAGLDILSLDRGPGIADLGRCLADGFSTAGSPGTGLGAMSRLSHEFDIHSIPGVGTATLARLWSVDALPSRSLSQVKFGTVSLPLAGEEVSGDNWAIEELPGKTLLFLVDGLGHGLQAAEAAREAIRVFRETSEQSPTEILQATHRALRTTRGAAVALIQLDFETHQARFAGVGNIAGSILGSSSDRSVSMVSHNGIVGHTIRKIQEFVYPWAPDSLLIMHSDGLGTHWQLSRYAGLSMTHPGLIAGVLYRDFRRIRDDVTVVSIRQGN
jgi:anti-sigma regulatory factor (Ser/Thr protein kinase)